MAAPPIAAGKSSYALVDIPALFAELELQRSPLLLDLACGAGAYAIAAAQQIGPAGRVIAVDLWQEGIDTLRKRSELLGLSNLQACLADVSQRLTLESGCVDVCLMATVLQDLVADGTATAALRELTRVLKPRGKLAVVEFKPMDGPPGPPIGVRLSDDQVRALLQPFGLNPLGTREIGPTTYLSLFCNG
jgi:ubiquinone/menaquinone biosynthesis C-methylase UbiE